MKKKKVLLIGTCSDIKNNRFTGQSIMFDGVVKALEGSGYSPYVIDVSSRWGSSSIYRMIDYLLVLIKELCVLCRHKVYFSYIVTSQSRRGFYRDFFMVTLLRIFRVKVIAHQYGANYNQLLDSVNKLEKYLLVKNIDYISKIIVEGEYMKNQFSFYDGYRPKVDVVPNGLPTEGKNMGIPKVYDKNAEPFTLFYLSNLIFSKGYFDVLKAVNLLNNTYKMNVKCIFAGQFMSSADDVHPGISNKANFYEYIDKYDLSDYITYFPGLYGEDKDYYFHKSHAFILPTYYINEGQPVSILEAMAYGCVPIVTKYRHIPMMVDESNGCYVNPSSPESICKSIIELVKNPELYQYKSQKAIEDYKTKFTFDKFTASVLKIFNEIDIKE